MNKTKGNIKRLHHISSEKRTLKQQWRTAIGLSVVVPVQITGNSQRMPLTAPHVTFLEVSENREPNRMLRMLGGPLHLPINCDGKAWNNRDSHPLLVRIQNIVATSRESQAASYTSARWYSYWTELQIPRSWKLMSTQNLAQGCFG